MREARYDGLADEYDAFVDEGSAYYWTAADTLARLLGHGLGWEVVRVDVSRDQLRVARDRFGDVEFVEADATALPFPDASYAAYSTFTHTDFDGFAGAVAEARRVVRPGGRFVYVGNRPCFVGATQEHLESGLPRLHPGYRRAGRWNAAAAPGATPGGWRGRLGSFVHLPLGAFLAAFAGLTLTAAEELDDGWE